MKDRPAVRATDASEADRITAVLALAFAGDPGIRATYPEPERFLARFPAFVAAYGGSAYEHGTALVAGDFLGAALWLPPGVEQDAKALAEAVIDGAPQAMLDGGFEVMGRAAAFHPKEPHWYLAMLGVDPRHQGCGAGSALLAAQLERIDAEGLPVFIETTGRQNLPLYERFGFEILDEFQAPDGTWSVWPMLRPAR